MSYISGIRAKVGQDPVILVGVCGIIASDDKILLQRRIDNGMWCLPGGLMELRETALDTLRRELREEIGVEVSSAKFFGVYTNRPIITYPNGDQSQPIGIFLRCNVVGKARAKDETLEITYFRRDELPENTYPIHREPIMDFFDAKENVLK